GIPTVDDQHKHLIFLCNKFRSELMECQSGEIKEWYMALQGSLKEAAEYAETHFATEEKLMQASQYDEYEYHKFCHKSFIETVAENMSVIDSATLESAIEFSDYLKDWILSHISYEDKRFADHVKNYVLAKKNVNS
ncbi:MAG: hemerythrin family protein, partial [Spirochaetaceae bacterium]|nr:hemerythrin family protein [Spirochaetaceae bacterium]